MPPQDAPLPSTFQHTHPHRVRPGASRGHRPCPTRFNTCTRTKCYQHSVCTGCRPDNLVSTHAPAQGATRHPTHYPRRLPFQHTHPYKVRPGTMKSFTAYSLFQHTHLAPRARCDLRRIGRIADEKVSTHAPTQGATETKMYKRPATRRFNTRTRTGCDTMVVEVDEREGFQHTHPHRVRRTPSPRRWTI